MTKLFIGGFILFSGFTQTLASPSSGILGRLALPDLFGFGGIVLFVLSASALRKNTVFIGGFSFLLSISLGLLYTQSFYGSLIEVFAHILLFLIFVIIVSTYKSSRELIQLWF